MATMRLMAAVTIAVTLAYNAPAHAEQPSDQPDRQAAALRLVNATHFMERQQRAEDAVAGSAMINFLGACTKTPPTYPWHEAQCKAPEKTWTRVAERLAADRPARLTTLQTLAIHLYATTYTTDELNQASAFYESPVGRKLLSDDVHSGQTVYEQARLGLDSALSRAEQDVIKDDTGPAK